MVALVLVGLLLFPLVLVLAVDTYVRLALMGTIRDIENLHNAWARAIGVDEPQAS